MTDKPSPFGNDEIYADMAYKTTSEPYLDGRLMTVATVGDDDRLAGVRVREPKPGEISPQEARLRRNDLLAAMRQSARSPLTQLGLDPTRFATYLDTHVVDALPERLAGAYNANLRSDYGWSRIPTAPSDEPDLLPGATLAHEATHRGLHIPTFGWSIPERNKNTARTNMDPELHHRIMKHLGLPVYPGTADATPDDIEYLRKFEEAARRKLDNYGPFGPTGNKGWGG